MESLKFSKTHLSTVVDIFIVLLCFLLVHKVYFGDLQIIPERMIVLLFSIGATYALFALGGTYSDKNSFRLSAELSRLTLCFALVLLLTGLFAFLSKIAIDVSRLWFGVSMLLSYIGLMGYRLLFRFYRIWLSKKGHYDQTIVMAGSGALSRIAIDRLNQQSWIGIKVDGVFDDSLREDSGDVQLAGNLNEIAAHVESRRRSGSPVDQVWVALPMKEEQSILELVEALKDSSTDVCILPSLLASQLVSGTQFQVGDLSVVNVSDVRFAVFGEWFKKAFDYITASVAIVVLSPIMLMVAIAIRLDSPGKILFKQRRYGIDGQEIEVWKFRTMTVSEDGATVSQAKVNDSRVTKIGRFLRRTSLDEIPQFFNVLQGRMSVVGPRPHAVSHNEEYRKVISGYMMRHKIKPGITGLAQVKGWRGETDTVEKMQKRVQYDLEYIKNWSAWLDIKIVLLTIIRGFNSKNAY